MGIPLNELPDEYPKGANPKDEAGRKKPCIHHLPLTALLPVAKVMTLGNTKYGPFNWREGEPLSLGTYVSATFRHLAAMWDGQWFDEESDQPHAAHIVANMLIIIDCYDGDHLVQDGPKG
jgi:hypothetical protein